MTTYGKNMNDLEKYMKQQIKSFMDDSSSKVDDIMKNYISEWYSQNSGIVKSKCFDDLYTSVNASITKDIKQVNNGYELIIQCHFGDASEQSFKGFLIEPEQDEPDFQYIYDWFCDGLINHFKDKGLAVTRG